LTANDLYLDDAARPRADAPLVGHKYIICNCIKSHPVAYVSSSLPSSLIADTGIGTNADIVRLRKRIM
jgi:hypothetical protein